MSIFDAFETDESKEVQGVEVPFPEGTNKDGTVPTFIIAATSTTNKEYQKELEKATKPYRRSIDSLPAEKADRIYKSVFVKTILKGWKNVQDKNGQEIPFEEGFARGLLEKLPRLYQELTNKANSIELFKTERREEEAKN